MREIDREAPTPRISQTFAVWHERAVEIVELLGGVEMLLSRDPRRRDIPESRVAVAMVALAREFARRFQRWSVEPITDAHRISQREQFEDFARCARRFIAEHNPKG